MRWSSTGPGAGSGGPRSAARSTPSPAPCSWRSACAWPASAADPYRERTLGDVPRGRGRAFDGGEPPERPADPAVRRANLRRIVRLFRPYRLKLSAVLALIVVSAILGAAAPFLLVRVFDVAIPDQDEV